MLATVRSPTWVIDGRDPARTPQPRESETRWKMRSTAWACWLYPRSGVGGAWLFATPRCRDAHAARRIGQCAKPGKPLATGGCRQGTQFQKWGELRDWYVE